MTEAALGGTIRVPGLAGDVELEIEPGTQPGAIAVIRGAGMPALQSSRRGDLVVRLDVAVPTTLTDDQRELLHDFARGAGDGTYAPRGDDEGFFQRLKSALR
jgi:molecular chaperone DnaJ